MTNLNEPDLERACAAWKELTGQPLLAWSEEAPGEVPPGVRAAAQGGNPATTVQVAGQDWLAACLRNARPAIYLAASDPGPQARPLFNLLADLLDKLAVERTASLQLTGELNSAWNRLNFLFEMARIAAQAADLPAMLGGLARSMLPVFPVEETCLIYSENEQRSENHRRGVFTGSGRPLPGLESLASLSGYTEPLLVIERGQGLPAGLAAHTPQINNLVLLPLTLQPPTSGLIGLVNYPAGEVSASDRQLLLNAGEQISTLINSTMIRAVHEAKRRLDHELELASLIQENMLPTSLPQAPGFEFGARLKPAQRVGGDFYDVQPVEGGLAVLVGDVSGKGVPAAMLTTLIHATLKSEVQHHNQPGELLGSIHRLIYDELDRSNTFITAFLAVVRWDPLQLSYASAGHTSSLLWQAGRGEILALEATGLPLGVEPDFALAQHELPLSPGDVLLLYSDGITEAENSAGRVFGMGALADLLLAAHLAPVQDQIGVILSALDLHRGKLPLQDDAVLFLARALPDGPGPEKVVPFVYPADKRSVRSLAILARTTAAALPFPSQAQRTAFVNDLELAVAEIAANIVIHAYGGPASSAQAQTGRIQGCISLYPGKLCLDLIDHGQPFDPESSPPAYSLNDPPDGGYGLLIARRLLNTCQYSRLSSQRNHWRLEKCYPTQLPT